MPQPNASQKENEPQCDRSAVIDPGLSPDSPVYFSATMQGGASTGHEPKNNDTIKSLDGTRSVGDNNNAETVGTGHNNDAEIDGTTRNSAEHLFDLLCALNLDNALFGERSGNAARHVKFNDALNTCHHVTPYSDVYGFLLSTMVATRHCWKCVSARACHFSGKSCYVVKARLAANARKQNHDAIDKFMRTMVRTIMGKMNGENT